MDRIRAQILLRAAVGDPDAEFRGGQWEAIDAVVNHRGRLLVVQRTGWGKSIVYFIATRILRDRGAGPTLIVSPLLALMRNQIEAASRLSMTALSINSTNTEEWPALTESIMEGRADTLLISPERLANEGFVRDVLLPVADRVGLLVVDEAHCISDWGHDFRPDYRRLVGVLRHMPANMPVLCTTATANSRVVADIMGQLGGIDVMRGPLMRETLRLQTMRLADQPERLAWLAEHLPKLPGTGIVYVLTRRDAEIVAEWLTRNGIDARAYHSDVTDGEHADSNGCRQHLERLLLENGVKALVATTALGMGYDKPDLGFVVHFQAPGSIIAYYQQVGRAGRAIGRAFGILMSGVEDGEIHAYFRNSAFPDEAHVAAVLEALSGTDGLTQGELDAALNLRRGQIEKVLKFLSVENPAPVLKDGSKWLRTPVAYQMDHERIRRLTEQREREWREVQEYIDTPGCLMLHLARALDDESATSCGKCARCLGVSLVDESRSHECVVEATRFLKRSELPLICHKQAPKDAFPVYGFKGRFPEELRPMTGRTLSRWGDAGWGRIVAEGKHGGLFSDDLVEAAFQMITERWRPMPAPEWIACVPSREHPRLVPGFCERLAARLGVPFLPALAKIRDNQPQKLQQNRFHQCRNLDGVFAVEGPVAASPVLLVDDIVDSAWTMTVTGALLLRAGSGAVWPLALATTRPGD
ncbi:MAG: RecQ family ATP-dependent DNA helicase [Candidatus Hydrogenedentes bacterium]|nr:RecQ family ATP-dependent DNA helicase [Candidatus Hydrogenedentota bacterium]